MFYLARIRLTLWYILIISVVSMLFSTLIYHDVSWELERGFQAAERRIVGNPYTNSVTNLVYLQEQLKEAKRILLMRLMIVNGVIIGLSGVASFFLAGKTLKPLVLAIDEQKRFVSDASHELRTPLTSLRSEIEVAMRDKNLTKKEAHKLLKSNLEDVEKMQKLINYLLSLSRYEKIKELPKEKIDLAEVVLEVATKYKKKAKDQGVKLETNVTPVMAKLHKASVEELISILTDNAIKFTPKGGKVSIMIRCSNKRAIVKVMDTGIGIPKKDIPHIFDRFFRSDLSRSKAQHDGYGLGLSIAKSIVEAQEGEIKVKSSSKGSTFTVVL